MSKVTNTNHFKAEGLNSYPTAVKNLPCCCWRMETVNGRMTKVPHNPKIGQKSHVDNDGTFTDFQTAMNSMERSKHWCGIGVKASGNVGFIDIDGCLENNKLSTLATQVLDSPWQAATHSSWKCRCILLFLL